jgi:hypothetical protein
MIRSSNVPKGAELNASSDLDLEFSDLTNLPGSQRYNNPFVRFAADRIAFGH